MSKTFLYTFQVSEILCFSTRNLTYILCLAYFVDRKQEFHRRYSTEGDPF